MKRSLAGLSIAVVAAYAVPVHASCHLFFIDQLFSNADGSVQYVVMRETSSENGEHFWAGQSLRVTGSAGTNQFQFPSNLPSSATGGKSVLIGTTGLSALGVIALDYTIPDGFIPTDGSGTLTFSCNGDQMSLAGLPTDGATAKNGIGANVPASPKNFAGNTVALTLAPPGGGGPNLNQHGLTGSWYEPATDGQGIELEIYPNYPAAGAGLVQGAWFTFDSPPAGGAERQRWYTFSGTAQDGSSSTSVTINRNVGGNFNAPPMTAPTVVGSGTLSFTRCHSGTFSYTFSDGSGRSGTIPITRITPNVTCAHGTAPTTSADFALSGNWYDPATDGQGFVFEVNPNAPFFFLTWYTYAAAGATAGAAGQRWFTGGNAYTPGNRSITGPLNETTGGVFDQVTDPAASTLPVGTFTVTFASCTTAQLHFNFTSGINAGKSDMIALRRIGPTPAGCVVAMSSSAMPDMGYDATPGMGYGGYGP